MRRTDVAIIGGGQAGLAMSYHLVAAGIDHVVLERGEVGERWRREQRESLRLLTPNWMTRLPGFSYGGPDPDGFMTVAETVAFLSAYADAFGAPVETGVEVRALRREGEGYILRTSGGTLAVRAVVIATGDCGVPAVPPAAMDVPDGIHQLVPQRYHSPSALPEGGVLVIGASASGVQIADELARAGRSVTLAVGRHVRVPRTHRGRDIMAWLDEAGILDERAEAVPDIAAARRQPSFQLLGSPERRPLDLASLAGAGVRLAGHVAGIDGPKVVFADDLAGTVERAERKLDALLARIDAFAAAREGAAPPPPAPRPAVPVDGAPRLDLAAERVGTIVWATGYRRAYPWLRVPVLDGRAEIAHAGGVTAAPGLFVLGLRFMRRRKSSFIDGVGADAAELMPHLTSHLAAVAGHPRQAVRRARRG